MSDNARKKEVREMTQEIEHIYVEFSMESLFGGNTADELANTDQEASAQRFGEMLDAALQAAYPDTKIEVVEGSSNVVTVDGHRDTSEHAVIAEIKDRLYNGFEWWVEVETKIEPDPDMGSVKIERMYLRNVKSGEVVAAEVDMTTGKTLRTCGPLYYTEVTPANLDNMNYDDPVDDDDWDNDWVRHDPYPDLNDLVMTPVEIAQATGTAESTWRNKAAAGEIPGAVKKGKQWLIPREYVQDKGYDV
jgi:hypothetical protein